MARSKTQMKNYSLDESIIFYEDQYLSLIKHEQLKAYELKFKVSALDLFELSDAEKITAIMISKFESVMKVGDNFEIVIINTLAGGPIMVKEVQNHIHETLFPFYIKHNLKTHLLCLSEEVMSKLSMTLTAEDVPTNELTIEFFSNYDDCIAYILNR